MPNKYGSLRDAIKSDLEYHNVSNKLVVFLSVLAFILVGGLIFGACYGIPKYKVYMQEMEGKAKLREAESSRQIAVEEAKAKAASAKLLSEAEVERAKGVAEANKIIGDSLKGNDSYLRYLWIQGLNDSSGEVIYIPTEANLPIMEAGKRNTSKAPEEL